MPSSSASVAVDRAPALTVDALSVVIAGDQGPVHALDAVELRVEAGRTLAIVGESGSGKTVCALAMIGLLPRGRATVLGGGVTLAGERIVPGDGEALRRVRGDAIAMVFQEPMTALNPVLTIGEQVAETLVTHRRLSWRAAGAEAERLLGRVRLPDPAAMLGRYPHQLSGGQRQRAMIAMAIACRPRVLIADEPTTALDVTVQAEVMQLLRQLQHEDGMALVLITHDFGVVAEMADDVAVMYAGRVVETGSASAVIAHPAHPYTAGLIRATALLPARTADSTLPEIPGTVPTMRAPDPGCSFRARCPHARERCTAPRPRFVTVAPGHLAACVMLGA
jgi:oligopeptide/dipeptide ABC transporter ATP-binding protein